MAKIRINKTGRKVSINKGGQRLPINGLDAAPPVDPPDEEEPPPPVTGDVFSVAKAIFPYGVDTDTSRQRIPTVVAVSPTRFIVDTQQMNSIITASHDSLGMRLASRVVDWNPTTRQITVGPTQVIRQLSGWANGEMFSGHPGLFKLSTGRILRMWNDNYLAPDRVLHMMMMYSDDLGETWSAPVMVQEATNGSDNLYASAGGNWIAEIPAGQPNAGRIVWGVFDYGVKMICYTDDFFQNITIREFIIPDSSEVSIAWSTAHNQMLAEWRDDRAGVIYGRWRATSPDAHTWSSVTYDTEVHSGRCHASLLNWGSEIAISTPSLRESKRFKGAVQFSADLGATWPKRYYPTPFNQSFGYSAQCALDENTLVTIFESNTDPQQGFNIDEGIKCVIQSRAYIIEQLYPPPITTKPGAQALYDAYAARVAADGGVIAEPAHALQAIQFALDWGMAPSVAVSGRWGYKLSGAAVVKLYSLFGADMEIAGTGSWTLNTAAGFNKLAGASGAYFRSTPIKLADGGQWAMGISGAVNASIRQLHTAIDSDGANSPFYSSLQTTGSAGIVVCADGDGTIGSTVNFDTCANDMGLVHAGLIGGGIVWQARNGVESLTPVLRSFATRQGALLDFNSMTNRVLLGARKNGGTYTTSQAYTVNEFWYVPEISRRQAVALSGKLDYVSG